MNNVERFISFEIKTRRGEEKTVTAKAEADPVVREQYKGRVTGGVVYLAENENGKRMYGSPVFLPQDK